MSRLHFLRGGITSEASLSAKIISALFPCCMVSPSLTKKMHIYECGGLHHTHEPPVFCEFVRLTLVKRSLNKPRSSGEHRRTARFEAYEKSEDVTHSCEQASFSLVFPAVASLTRWATTQRGKLRSILIPNANTRSLSICVIGIQGRYSWPEKILRFLRLTNHLYEQGCMCRGFRMM